MKERRVIIDKLRLKQYYNNGISKNHKSYKRKSRQNNTKTVTNEKDKEILMKDILYISRRKAENY